MAQISRSKRLRDDWDAVQALAQSSSIFACEHSGDPPDRYTLIFRGKGICRDSTPRADVDFVDEHRCDIRLPYSYPNRPPDIRWLTPIFHPNVSFSGFLDLRDVGLPWEQDLGLDVVCERLWDVARMAFVNPDKTTNYAARNWLENDCTLDLPVDPRPLRDGAPLTTSNVVRYERRGRERLTFPGVDESGVLFIGEDTPVPEMPVAPARRGDDDILYIGDFGDE